MTREELLKNCIIGKYKNINIFCNQSKISYSTIASILKRGIMGSGVGNVVKICKYLNIDVESLINGEIKERRIDDMTHHEKTLVTAYRKQPDMQTAVDKLLGITTDTENVPGTTSGSKGGG